MKTYALVSDLLFKSKIAETAAQSNREVLFTEDPASIREAEFVIVDLDRFGTEALTQIQEDNPGAKMIGYCSHVNAELIQRAYKIGVHAMPRSMFVNQLPALFSLY